MEVMEDTPRPRTSDLADFLRTTGPVEGVLNSQRGLGPSPPVQAEQGVMARLKTSFLRSRKKSQSLRPPGPSIPSEQPPVPLTPGAPKNMRKVYSHEQELAANPAQRTGRHAAGHSPHPSGDMLLAQLHRDAPNSRHSAYDFIHSRPSVPSAPAGFQGDPDDFTETRMAPKPPGPPLTGPTFSPLLESPIPMDGSPGTPTSRLHFPHPPSLDARPPLASHKSLDILPGAQVNPASDVIPPSHTFLNVSLSQGAAEGNRPELSRRPSRVRLNWADSLPLNPLIAPTIPSEHPVSSGEHPSPPTPGLQFVKSPTSTSAKMRFSALIDEAPPCAPPSHPPPAAPLTSFSMRSMPSIPSMTSSPEEVVGSPRIAVPRPLIPSTVKDARRSSKDEVIRELGSHRIKFDELAGYLQKILTSHEETKEIFTKRLDLLETELRKRDEEIRGLRWLIMNVDPSSMAGNGSLSAVEPPAVSQLPRAVAHGGHHPEAESERRPGLKRSSSLPRNLSLSSFSLDFNTVDAIQTASGITLPTPPGSFMKLDFSSRPLPSAPPISPPTLSIVVDSALTQRANGTGHSNERASPTGPPESKLRKLQLLADREVKMSWKGPYRSCAPPSSPSTSTASLAYARNLDGGMVPSIDGVLSQTPASPKEGRI